MLNLVRNPLRQAVLYPWAILTVERWAEQRYHFNIPQLGVVQYLGLSLICAGAVLCLFTMVQFVVDGAGTPEPYAGPVLLISRGVFQWTRNPLYLGMTVILAGEAAYNLSLSLVIYALWWFAEFVRRARREEATMLKRHGEAYVRYAEKTPQWFALLPDFSVERACPTSRIQLSGSPSAQREGQSLAAERMLRKTVVRVGRILTSFAAVGYINDFVAIFSATTTPFLWFDPLENLFHLVPGLTLVAVASAPRLGLEIGPAYRPLRLPPHPRWR